MDDRKIQIIIDSFWPLLKAGVFYTIPLTLITFALGLVLGRNYCTHPIVLLDNS